MTIMDAKKRFLTRLYRIHDAFCADQGVFACQKGCDTCCTGNVTMTTLEGLYLLEHMEAAGRISSLSDLAAVADGRIFRPKITINQLADLCMRDEDIPEDQADLHAGPCLLLADHVCPVYDARPLGCRAMLSQSRCAPDGQADMPESVLAVNTVMGQYLEAMDQPGFTGNLVDILRFLRNPVHSRCYQQLQVISKPDGLLPNKALPALMVPPQQRDLLQPVISRIQDAMKQIFSGVKQ